MQSIFLLCFLLTPSGSPHLSDSAQALVPAEHNPLYLRFLRPDWQPFSQPGQTRFKAGMSWYYANLFERRSNDVYIQDMDSEMLSGDAHLIWRVSPQLSLQFNGGVHRFTGGFLDETIQSFHDAFGLPNDDRDQVADGRSILLFQTTQGQTLFSADSQTWHLEDPQLSAGWTFASGPNWTWSAGITAKIPLGSGPFHNSHFDGALDLHGRRLGDRWRLDFQFGLLSLSPEAALEPITRSSAGYAMLWLDRRWGAHTHTFVQIDSTTPYFHNTGLDSLDPAAVNFIIGITRPLGKSWHWLASFGEDLIARGPSLDFSLNLGLQAKFGSGK